MKKKILALIMAVIAVVMCLTLAACNGNKPSDGNASDGNASAGDVVASDLDYIKNKGEMVIGYTLFAPMDYEDENGALTGFEVDFGKAVCEKIGVEPKFQLIKWEAKETELNAKTIDCIWNGMTITDERMATMSISTPYMANKQVLLVKAENADKFTTAEALNGAKIVAEAESAGEGVAKEDPFFAGATYTAVDSQAKALMEVASGLADGCVVDYVLSIGMIGEGTDYADLVVVDELSFADEQYGIAFRKDSDVTAAVNSAIAELIASGELEQIAAKYKLSEQIITQ